MFHLYALIFVFWHCSITYQIWQLFSTLVVSNGLCLGTHRIFCIVGTYRGCTKQEIIGLQNSSLYLWVIKCFEEKRKSVQRINLDCISLFHFWCKKEYVNEAETLLDFIDSPLRIEVVYVFGLFDHLYRNSNTTFITILDNKKGVILPAEEINSCFQATLIYSQWSARGMASY